MSFIEENANPDQRKIDDDGMILIIEEMKEYESISTIMFVIRVWMDRENIKWYI